MKTISSKVDYPNMTCEEIIASGISLSGDALELFMQNTKESANESLSEFKETVGDAIYHIKSALDNIEDEL